ncbi:MAG: BglII/BstYI family type II restriction endonuclease [bacterium]|nr:BglII/BstYI family type II restriction endonuclease [bacterium]
MGIEIIPKNIKDKFEIYEFKHACAVLSSDFPVEWREILTVLSEFELKKKDILTPGGGKSPIAKKIDEKFYQFGWVEKQFDTSIKVDKDEYKTPTHGVDCFKNKIALEIEWNNKDPFYDRDLNNFRLLFDLRVISVGVIITRSDELQEIFDSLGKGMSYGPSTTHMSKLLFRINGGGSGGCPVLIFGITKKLYSAK